MGGKLSFMCAPARSGKSTYAAKWQKEPDPDGLTRVVLSGDQIRLALHGMRYCTLAEPIVHGIYPVLIRTLLQGGYHVLADDTHTSVTAIHSILKINSDAQVIFIDTSEEVCIQRAIDTNQPDLIPVIGRMFNNLKCLCVEGLYHKYGTSNIMGEVKVTERLVKQAIEYIRIEVKTLEKLNRTV